jgi:hypothetical protein
MCSSFIRVDRKPHEANTHLTSYRYRTDDGFGHQDGPTIEEAIHQCLRLRNTSSKPFPLHEMLDEAQIRYGQLHDAKLYYIIATKPRNEAETVSEQHADKLLKGSHTGLKIFKWTLDESTAWPSDAVTALMAK